MDRAIKPFIVGVKPVQAVLAFLRLLALGGQMLERLDETPWAELSHAYGPATDVPALIRALAASSGAEREKVMWTLYGNLWHQGTVYEATAHAVPFLLEMLEEPAVSGKADILVYLKALAFGNSYLDAHQNLFLFQEEREKPDFQDRLNVELGWVRAAHRAVAEGVATYSALLDHADPRTRSAAAYLLLLFNDETPHGYAALQARFEIETDETMLGTLAYAFGRVHPGTEGAVSAADLAAKHPLASVRALAATGAAYRLGFETPPGIRKALVEALSDPRPMDAVLRSCPWADEDARVFLAHAVRACGAKDCLYDLIAALEAVSPVGSWSMVAIILAIAFEEKPLAPATTPHALTEPQRKALAAVSSSKAFWTGIDETSSVVNVSEIMRAYNLPDKPAAFAAFLTGDAPLGKQA